MYLVYILYSAQIDRYYTGSAPDPQLRLKKHLAKHTGFTSKAKDWVIVYQESVQGRAEALKRENKSNAGRIEPELKNSSGDQGVQSFPINHRLPGFSIR